MLKQTLNIIRSNGYFSTILFVLFCHQVRAEAPLAFYENNKLTHNEREILKNFYLSHLQFNQQLQKNSLNAEDLGEPKFLVDGSVYSFPWVRPQNDSPALPAKLLMHLLRISTLEDWPSRQNLIQMIYQPAWPNRSLVKSDLEYTAYHWQNLSFDLWEEVYGYHFFTLMAERKALRQGAALADQFQDAGAANYYLMQVQEINSINFDFFHSFTQAKKLSLNQVIFKDSALLNTILRGLITEADSYLERIIYHQNPDGSLSEQISRITGYMQRSPNLTWSHASFLIAKMARDRAPQLIHTTKGHL